MSNNDEFQGINIENLDLNAKESPKCASAGYHRAQLIGQEFAESKNNPGNFNFVLEFQLSDKDPDTPGRKMKAWVSCPSPQDKDQYYADGRTKMGAKLDWLSKILAAFGHSGGGKLNKTMFHKYIGKFVDILIENEIDPETGDTRDRINLAFGDGIKKVTI